MLTEEDLLYALNEIYNDSKSAKCPPQTTCRGITRPWPGMSRILIESRRMCVSVFGPLAKISGYDFLSQPIPSFPVVPLYMTRSSHKVPFTHTS
jgi:hypothetical protein